MGQHSTIAVVGGESLIARELRDLIHDRRVPIKLNLVGVDDDALTLSEQDGEPAVITPLDEESLGASRVVLLSGSRASSIKALDILAKLNGPVVIDLTYTAEDEPAARLRAPMVEPSGYEAPPESIHVIAHPAAVALALFLLRLGSSTKIRRSVAHIFEPASERGQQGLDELRQQTVSLLSFRSMPKTVFDAQAGFNLLTRYGEEAIVSLESVELRIEKHLASLLAGRRAAPLPSIRLVQAPVFHGHSVSVYVEFAEAVDLASVVAALSGPSVDVRAAGEEPPDNISIAGQDGIAVGAISQDRSEANGWWFWLVADNFRLMAGNALAVACSQAGGTEEG